MPLQKQQFYLSVQDGLDTKTDDKNVIETKFTELENVRFTASGRFTKRPGNDALTTTRIDATSVNSAHTLTTFNGEELVQLGTSDFNAYSSSQAKWVKKHSETYYNADQESVTAGKAVLLSCSTARYGNYDCYAFSFNDDEGLKYLVKDSVTGTALASGTVLSVAAGVICKVVVMGTKFVIVYIDSGNIKYKYIDTTAITTLSSAATITAGTKFDCLVGSDGNFYLLYVDAGSAKIRYMSSLFVVSSATTLEAATIDSTQYMTVNQENTNYRFSYVKNGTGIRTVLYSSTLASNVHALVTISSTSSALAIAAVNNSTTTNLYATLNPSGVRYIQAYNINSSGTVATGSILAYSCTLQSEIAQLTVNSTLTDYMVVMPYNGLFTPLSRDYYNSYFLINESGEIVARFEPDNGVGLATAVNSIKFSLMASSSTAIKFTGASLNEVQSYDGNAASGAVNIVDYSATLVSAKMPNIELGKSLLISGAVPKIYDGVNVVEQGFLQTPGAPLHISTQNSSGGGATAALGDPSGGANQYYSWIAVFAWRDANGYVHRSAPSAAMTQLICAAAPAPYKTETLYVPVLNFTNKSNVIVELYRTTANGTTFYKVRQGAIYSLSGVINNDKTANYISFTDDLPDTVIENNEILYTTGGVLDNTPVPDSKFLTTYGDRAFSLNGAGTVISYSKQNLIGSPIEFNDALQIQVPSKGGLGTALASMDNSLLIFKQRNIFYLSGNGPNDLGEQSDYGLPQEITIDAGCTEPGSIVKTPIGLIFKSTKGIYIIKRNFSVEYIGAPVEAYNSLTITSAVLLDNTTEIHFTTNSSRMLIYDYYHNRWTTDAGITAIDSCNLSAIRYVTTSAGQVYKENSSSFADGSSFIATKISTAWIKLSALQGFKRFYEVLLLGQYKSAHNLKVSIAYDYNNTYTHNVTFTPGSSDPYQYRINPQVQKCEAFKLKIEDIYTNTNGESYNLSNIAVEVGMKTGLDKIPAARYKGVSSV